MIHFLGTGSAVTDPHRTTTMLAFSDPASILVVDCGGDVVQRLQQAHLALAKISAVIITHEHPDHVSGFALMIQKLWLAGRREPLPVCGIATALAQARRCLLAFDTSGWDRLFQIDWREVPHAPGAAVFADETWRVTATPALHRVPNVALRIAHPGSGRVAVYSGDTGPSDEISQFARGAGVLIHEATGAHPGHSTASDAARVAAACGAERLYLVHLPPEQELDSEALSAARAIFPTTLKAEELGAVEW